MKHPKLLLILLCFTGCVRSQVPVKQSNNSLMRQYCANERDHCLISFFDRTFSEYENNSSLQSWSMNCSQLEMRCLSVTAEYNKQ
jgi:hypothetical protein